MNCNTKHKSYWVAMVVIITQAIVILSLIIKCINFKAEICNRQMRIRIFASEAQEIVDELIKLHAIEELTLINSELPKELIKTDQKRLTPDFWNKWSKRVHVLKDNNLIGK